MVYCDYCRRNVSGMRPDESSLCCECCGKVLEDFYVSQEATFVKDAAGQRAEKERMTKSLTEDSGAQSIDGKIVAKTPSC